MTLFSSVEPPLFLTQRGSLSVNVLKLLIKKKKKHFVAKSVTNESRSF